MNSVENSGCKIHLVSSVNTFCADNISDVILTDLSSRQKELIEMLDASEVFQSVSKKAPIKIKGGFVREFCVHFTDNIQREFGFTQPEQMYRSFKDIDGVVMSKVDLFSELGEPIVIEREGSFFYLFRIYEEIEKELVFFDENQETVPVLFEHDLINLFYFQGQIYIDREGFLEGVLALHQKQLKLIPKIEQVEYDVFGRIVAYLTWGWNVDPLLLNTLKNHCCKLNESVRQAFTRHFEPNSLEGQVFLFNAILWGGASLIWEGVPLLQNPLSPLFEGLAPYLQKEEDPLLSAALFLLNALKHPTFAKVEKTRVTLYSEQNRFFVELPASIEDLIESLVLENLSREWFNGDLVPLMLEDSVVNFIASLFDRSFDLCHFFLLRYYYAVFEEEGDIYFPKHWELILAASGPIRQPWLLEFFSKRKPEFALRCFLKLSSEEKKQMANFIDQAAKCLSPSSFWGESETLLSLRSYISTKRTLDALFSVLIKKKEKENLYKFLGSSIHTRESLCSYIAELLLYPRLWEEKGLLKFINTVVSEDFFDEVLYQGVLKSALSQTLNWPNGKIACQLFLYYLNANKIDEVKHCIKRDLQSVYVNTLPDDYGILLLRFWEEHEVCFEEEVLNSKVSPSILEPIYLFLIQLSDTPVDLVKEYKRIAICFAQAVIDAISSPYQKVLSAQILEKESELLWEPLLEQMQGGELESILSLIPSSVINQQLYSMLLKRLSDKALISWINRFSAKKKAEIASEELVTRLLMMEHHKKEAIHLALVLEKSIFFSNELVDLFLEALKALDAKALISSLGGGALRYPKIQKFARQALQETLYSKKEATSVLDRLFQEGFFEEDADLIMRYLHPGLFKHWIQHLKQFPFYSIADFQQEIDFFLKKASVKNLETLIEIANNYKEKGSDWFIVWAELYEKIFGLAECVEQLLSLKRVFHVPFAFSKIIENGADFERVKSLYFKVCDHDKEAFLRELFLALQREELRFSRDVFLKLLKWMQGCFSLELASYFIDYIQGRVAINLGFFYQMLQLVYTIHSDEVLNCFIPFFQILYDKLYHSKDINLILLNASYTSCIEHAASVDYYAKHPSKLYVDTHFIEFVTASFEELDFLEVKAALPDFFQRVLIYPQFKRLPLCIKVCEALVLKGSILKEEKLLWVEHLISSIQFLPNEIFFEDAKGENQYVLLYLFLQVYPREGFFVPGSFASVPCDEKAVLELFFQKIRDLDDAACFFSERDIILCRVFSFSCFASLYCASRSDSLMFSEYLALLLMFHRHLLSSKEPLLYFEYSGSFDYIFHTLLAAFSTSQLIKHPVKETLIDVIQAELDLLVNLIEAKEICQEKKEELIYYLELAFDALDNFSISVPTEYLVKLKKYKKAVGRQ